MKRAILTAGPQCAGKTTFCKEVVGLVPTIPYISRDEILIEMFRTTSPSNYAGEHQAALLMMWERVASALQPENVTLLLDCWNSHGYARKCMIEKLRQFDVTEIEIWYFTTPFLQCLRNDCKRNPRKRRDSTVPRLRVITSRAHLGHYHNDYQEFHRDNRDLAQQTFPRFLPIGIRHINPKIVRPDQVAAQLLQLDLTP